MAPKRPNLWQHRSKWSLRQVMRNWIIVLFHINVVCSNDGSQRVFSRGLFGALHRGTPTGCRWHECVLVVTDAYSTSFQNQHVGMRTSACWLGPKSETGSRWLDFRTQTEIILLCIFSVNFNMNPFCFINVSLLYSNTVVLCYRS